MDFMKDCIREEKRHAVRCNADPDYCLDYVREYGQMVMPRGRFEELSMDIIRELIERILEMLEAGIADAALCTALKALSEHLENQAFAKAVKELSGKGGGDAVPCWA